MKIAGIDIKFEYHDTLNGSPARCAIFEPKKRATIKIAGDFFSKFDQCTKMFVILHELGHAVLDSGDEEAVDRWAFKQYARTNLPLKGAVYAVSKVIDPINNEEHSKRTILQFNRANQRSFLRGQISWKKFINQKIK